MERDGVVRDFEMQLCRRDGTAIWVQNTAQAVRDADDRVLYYEGSLQDITKRRRAEESLARRAAQLLLINEIGRKVAAELKLDEVLSRATHLVQESFNYHRVALFTVDRSLAEREEAEFNPLDGGVRMCPNQCVLGFSHLAIKGIHILLLMRV